MAAALALPFSSLQVTLADFPPEKTRFSELTRRDGLSTTHLGACLSEDIVGWMIRRRASATRATGYATSWKMMKKALLYSIPTCSCLNKYRLAQSSWVSLRYKARTKRMNLKFGQDGVRMWSRCKQSYSVMPPTSSQLLPAIQVEAVLCPVLVLRVPGHWTNVNNFFIRSRFWKLQIWPYTYCKCCQRVIKKTKIIIICFLFDLKTCTSHHHQVLRYCDV